MKKIIFAICTILLLVSCIEKDPYENLTIIATVDNEHLTLEELEESYGKTNWEQMSKEEKNEIINQWINLTLLANHAKRNIVIETDRSLMFTAKNAQKKIYTNALIANEIQNINISEVELYNSYLARVSEYQEAVKEYRVQRIFFRNEQTMNRVKRMLEQGEIRFTPAAQQYSQEAIGRNGGYVSQYVTKTGVDSLLWRELNNKNLFQEISMPYQIGNQSGWLIARYINSQDGTANIDFFQVKDQIDAVIREEKREEIYEQLLNEAHNLSTFSIQY